MYVVGIYYLHFWFYLVSLWDFYQHVFYSFLYYQFFQQFFHFHSWFRFVFEAVVFLKLSLMYYLLCCYFIWCNYYLYFFVFFFLQLLFYNRVKLSNKKGNLWEFHTSERRRCICMIVWIFLLHLMELFFWLTNNRNNYKFC